MIADICVSESRDENTAERGARTEKREGKRGEERREEKRREDKQTRAEKKRTEKRREGKGRKAKGEETRREERREQSVISTRIDRAPFVRERGNRALRGPKIGLD